MNTRSLFRLTLPFLIPLILTACSSAPRIDQTIEEVISGLSETDVTSGCVEAESINRTISLLLVGNSLMNDIGSMLEELLACGGFTSNIATSNPGGYRLEQHLSNERTADLIANGYDLTLIQAHSNGITDHKKPYEVLNGLKTKINAAGSTMGFYQTWAFQNRDVVITERILSRYESIANEFNAPIIHIGRAWDYFYISHKESPPFQLFHDYAHATPHGKHLIAYTLYSYLTGQSPISLNSLSLDNEDASQLQTIAWATYKASSLIQSNGS